MESHSSCNSVSSRPISHSYLHSIKKPIMKPWKLPIAPFPPTPPKVYTVDPANFKDLVQTLTGPPESSDRLHNLAPPSLDHAAPLQLLYSTAKNQTFSSSLCQELAGESNDNQRLISGSLELIMSPSSHSWCSFPLLSPGTLSSLEQSTVLRFSCYNMADINASELCLLAFRNLEVYQFFNSCHFYRINFSLVMTRKHKIDGGI